MEQYDSRRDGYKGFDEVSGNFQVKNYTNRGAGADAVQAEAQDGASASPVRLNNANFSTPVEGSRPRMQMFLWTAESKSIQITAPASLAGPLTALEGSLGRRISAVGPITGNLVAVDDGSAKPIRGCNAPLVNAAAISGKIALIQRGKCNFAVKIRNAQNAGAKMVVMMDSIPNTTTLVNMGSTVAADTVGLRIPSIFITKADGDRLKAALDAGQTVSLSASSTVYYRDGDFDNGIITHEYGHGISTRLTGGAANSGCLPNTTGYETMGEGWSDFFGLWMTTKPGDVGTTPRGIGTYVAFQTPTGTGIRRKLYTTNFAVNNHTYAFLGTGEGQYAETHDVGEVWAATLWDLNWALIGRYGYNADMKASTGGNNICLQLVLDGLKLQKCTPGFIDGRNAILKADTLNNQGANSALIWSVFARRGMGVSATQGLSTSVSDQVVAYDMPAVLSTQKQLSGELLEVYPNPANNQVVVRTQISSSAPVQISVVTLLGQTVHTEQVAAARLQQEGVTLNTANLAAGVYIVRLTTSQGNITKKVAVQH
nr:M36 family metallopeptidase [Hymenobacter sp. AT01-02]